MDKILKSYYKELAKEPDHVDVSKELLKSWLDDKIEAQKTIDKIMQEHNIDLYYGDRKGGNYENDIQICGFEPKQRLHIYSGLRKLADALGIEVEKKERDDDTYPYKISFIYNGIEVFQIGDDDL